MKVEIWSDVACPFCFIGKKRFERGLAQFEQAQHVDVEWKSFMLDPELPTSAEQPMAEYLAQRKGLPPQQVKEMLRNVAAIAKEEGLDFQMDNIIVANTFTMHRIIQLAKSKGLGEAAEERFFKAYFEEGADYTNKEVLLGLAEEIGLDRTAVDLLLLSNRYGDEVQQDLYEAQNIGVRGVPYFVFNDKYVLTGAQSSETFKAALEKSFEEWQASGAGKTNLDAGAGSGYCTPEGDCA